MTDAPLQPGSTLSLDGADWQAHGYLGEEWRFREGHTLAGREREWLHATVPGSVLDDLRAARAIADPYVGRNSLLAEWVPERTWLYRRRFTLPADELPPRVRLRFEGIDYAAQVFLNGERLGAHEGTFVPAAWDVRELLRPGRDNLVAVVLDPAPASEPQVGRTERVRVHKPRMNYGWDFCPRTVHVGIWDSVGLHASGAARIEHVWVRARPAGERAATIDVRVRVDGPASRLDLAIDGDAGRLGATAVGVDGPDAEIAVELPDAPRWWSNGLGDAGLLSASVRLRDGDGAVSDERAVRFGVRTVELVANEGAPEDALPYTLVVNGRRTPVRGWNWVPLDACYGRRRPERLAHLLDLAAAARVNLLRVWGGGLIERDDVYDACDERGILAWQEFSQSSSGIRSVPAADPGFVERMRREAEAVVPRRRNHPSLAIWGGGNELTDDAGSPIDERHPVIAALADAVRRLDPGRAWLPSSPSGRAFLNRLDLIEADPEAQHDVHGPWEHQGPAEHYRLYNAGTSLLHSEFGVEGMANAATLRAVVPEGERWPADRSNPTYEHLGAWWNNAPSVVEWFGGAAFTVELDALDEAARLDALRRCSQLLQADGLRYAVESSRRRWPRSAGTLPWQLNEPFPNAWCTSVIDYGGRPKPAYWAVAEAYRAVCVGAVLERQALDGASTLPVRPWALSENAPIRARLELRLLAADGRVVDAAAQSLEVRGVAWGDPAQLALGRGEPDGEAGFRMLDTVLRDGSGARIAERRYLLSRSVDLSPLRAVAPTELRVDRDGRRIRVRNDGSRVAIGVEVLDAEHDDVGRAVPDRGWFHLVPGEELTVSCAWRPPSGSTRRVAVDAWNAPRVVV